MEASRRPPPQTCPLSRFCDKQRECKNFTSLSDFQRSIQAAIADTQRPCDRYFGQEDNAVEIQANAYRVPLNDQLDVYSFVSRFIEPTLYFSLMLTWFTGIDLNATLPSTNFTSMNKWQALAWEMRFEGPKPLDLYFNSELVEMSSDGGRTCDETQLLEIYKQTSVTFFSLKQTYLLFVVMSFPRKWCASTFKNVTLKTLMVYGQPVRFFSRNTSSLFDCSISNLKITKATIEHLDREVLHPQVFGRTVSISVHSSSIRKIEPDVLKDLTSLNTLYLTINNIKGFMHANGIDWMQYLNRAVLS